MQTLKFKPITNGLRFSLPSIILADPVSGNRGSLQPGLKVTSLGCDWWISIHFGCFCFQGSLAVAIIVIDGSERRTGGNR